MRTLCNAAYFQSLSLVRMCLTRQARRGRPRRRSLISRVLNRENDGGDDDTEFPDNYGFFPFLPSFLNLHSPLCLDMVLAGPRWSHPAPAYWQATRVPEQRYLEKKSDIVGIVRKWDLFIFITGGDPIATLAAASPRTSQSWGRSPSACPRS